MFQKFLLTVFFCINMFSPELLKAGDNSDSSVSYLGQTPPGNPGLIFQIP